MKYRYIRECKPILINQKRLFVPKEEKRNTEFIEYNLPYISSSLRPIYDVSKAKDLKKTNDNKKTGNKNCFQGQIPGNDAFLLPKAEAKTIIQKESFYNDVLCPYLVAEDLLGTKDSLHKRYAIDFNNLDIFSIQKYDKLYKIIEKNVLPKVKELAAKQELENKTNSVKKDDRIKHYKIWWTFWCSRTSLMQKLHSSQKYIACGRITKRPIFEFVSSKIHPSDLIVAFTFEDDYSFAILSSNCHYKWYNARCSTMKGDDRYTNTTCYNSFVWPQFGIPFAKNPDKYLEENKKEITELISNVAKCAREFYLKRDEIRRTCKMSLRDIYRTMEKHGENSLRNLQDKLNEAVLECYKYGTPKSIQSDDILEMLYNLNIKCAEFEEKDIQLLSPGLPNFLKDNSEFYTNYCIKPE